MNIRLLGFFDKNFGDDLMQLITVESMPEHKFYADASQKEFLTHFIGCKNVVPGGTFGVADACVYVVGTGFKYSSKINILSKIVSNLTEKKFAGEKTAVIDCSLDMPASIAERMLVKRELGKYRFISCRDAASKKVISRLTGKQNIRQYDDIVFAAGRKYIKENTGEGCLGIAAVGRMYSAENYAYYSAVAGACDEYVDLCGKRVLLFALDTGYENDLLAAMTIRRLMKNKAAVEIIAYDSRPEYIFENIARCDRLISSRFHGVIAGILSGVAVAAVSDVSKIDILSKRLGFKTIRKSDVTQKALLNLIQTTTTPVVLPKNVIDSAHGHLTELGKYLTDEADDI